MKKQTLEVNYSPYKTDDGKNTYYKSYNKCIAEWPVEVREIDIDNEFGNTHILNYGNPKGSILVLLHGMRSNSTIWINLAKEFAINFNVYSIDIIGDLGKSIAKRDLLTEDDYFLWLNSVFTELNLSNIILCGQSNGGFQAVNYAKHINDKVSKLVLLAPAATMQNTKISFFCKTMKTAIFPNDKNIVNIMKVISYNNQNWNKYVQEMSHLAYTVGVNRFKVYPRKLNDLELKSIKIPTLLIYGENEVMYSIDKAIERATRFIPICKTQKLSKCRHSIPNDAPIEAIKAIESFVLNKDFTKQSI